ncbi:sugar phosphate isomerase/epimerase family protein [Paenibacillus senegalensis]|uniref:sugar phosphate isomerase/epimerase family protein n=1 Tax=Paenibacillus senegalensis TaxID=1465766 RepID=UPI00028853EA|nr:sugar phosphate isomerase/epimerase family protein [Paenibacillus senegalensis]
MITLSGFADEISAELDEQLDILNAESIRYVEFRGVWNKNVLDLTDEQLQEIKQKMDKEGIRVSAIGSPIGKINITDPFDPHLEKFERAIHIAKFFNTRNIRIFSFFIKEDQKPEDFRDEVIRRMKLLVKRAEEADVLLLHENEKHIYGDNAERCRDLLESCSSANLRAVFDPANFVQCGVRPFEEAYPMLSAYIDYIHIKDAKSADGSVTVAGLGDGQIPELLRALKERNYSGFLSLEPHLQAAGSFAGFSGPGLFKEASDGLKRLLADLNWKWQ